MRLLGIIFDEDDALLAKAAAWRPDVSLDELTADALGRIAAEHDLDFATSVLYDRVMRSQRFAEVRTTIERLEQAGANAMQRPSFIAVVPGAFYLESPQTGAGGEAILATAAQLGIPCEVVPVKSFGSLAENSRIVGQWLADRRERSIVLVSLSKGGAEVKRAMADSLSAFDDVAAWINLSGILEQSPLAQWLLRQKVRSRLIRLWFWWRRYDFNVVHEYATQPVAEWCIPAHVRAIHVVGFPLQRHLSTPLARRGRRRLAALGPNDSAGNVLAEAVARPGTVVPVWGADHYLRPDGVPRDCLVRQLFALACCQELVPASDDAVAGAAP